MRITIEGIPKKISDIANDALQKIPVFDASNPAGERFDFLLELKDIINQKDTEEKQLRDAMDFFIAYVKDQGNIYLVDKRIITAIEAEISRIFEPEIKKLGGNITVGTAATPLQSQQQRSPSPSSPTSQPSTERAQISFDSQQTPQSISSQKTSTPSTPTAPIIHKTVSSAASSSESKFQNLQASVIQGLKQYLKKDSGIFFGDRHEARAKRVIKAIELAKTPQEIHDILLSQKNLFENKHYNEGVSNNFITSNSALCLQSTHRITFFGEYQSRNFLSSVKNNEHGAFYDAVAKQLTEVSSQFPEAKLAQIYRSMITAKSDTERNVVYTDLDAFVMHLAKNQKIEGDAEKMREQLIPIIKQAKNELTTTQCQDLEKILTDIYNDSSKEWSATLNLFESEHQSNITSAIIASAEIMAPSLLKPKM